jgi:hypothetical protein
MIRLPLTPAQQREAARSGQITVTDEQVMSLSQSRRSMLRVSRSGGRAPGCDCGTCKTCTAREYQRQRRSKA